MVELGQSGGAMTDKQPRVVMPTVVGRAKPTPEELAAIIAAIEMSWPAPALAAQQDDDDRSMWRFSGRRWLSQPGPARRLRPYSR